MFFLKECKFLNDAVFGFGLQRDPTPTRTAKALLVADWRWKGWGAVDSEVKMLVRFYGGV